MAEAHGACLIADLGKLARLEVTHDRQVARRRTQILPEGEDIATDSA
jgi:hypothetical protein